MEKTKIIFAVAGIDWGQYPVIYSDGEIVCNHGHIPDTLVKEFWDTHSKRILGDLEKDRLPSRYSNHSTPDNPLFRMRVYANDDKTKLGFTKNQVT